jgi:hypothetical protein
MLCWLNLFIFKDFVQVLLSLEGLKILIWGGRSLRQFRRGGRFVGSDGTVPETGGAGDHLVRETVTETMMMSPL